ncbi:MAG: class I SAM-dependent methyltransferase [Candidatus Hodarchaeota archaeon]
MNVVEQLLPKGTGRVLDVGCGNIDVIGLLYCYNRLKKNYDVLGIDINPGERENVLKASALKIPFTNQSIEYVVSFDVIEHIKDFSTALREMLRITKKRTIIIAPTTSKPMVRRIINILRRLIGGANSRLGEFLLQGHHYEFFPREILSFKGRTFRTAFFKIDFPLAGKSFLHRSGLIYAGIYVFERKREKKLKSLENY